jgi:hypothetical protein
MSAGIYNFTLDQGATFALSIVYKDNEGVPINLTGYAAAMQIRDAYDSSAAVLSLNTTTGGISIVGAEGKINITATASQTAAIPFGEYVYDLEISLSGVVTRVIKGVVSVSPEVTRA